MARRSQRKDLGRSKEEGSGETERNLTGTGSHVRDSDDAYPKYEVVNRNDGGCELRDESLNQMPVSVGSIDDSRYNMAEQVGRGVI